MIFTFDILSTKLMNLAQPITFAHYHKWKWMLYIILGCGILYVITKQITDFGQVSELANLISSTWGALHFLALVMIICLGVLNWWLEAKKWQILNPNLSLKESFKVILGGVSWGMVTPMQLGDYVGRSHATGFTNWKKTSYLTFVASIAQNIWNITGGVTWLMFFPLIMIQPLAPWLFYIWLALIILSSAYFFLEKLPIRLISTFDDNWVIGWERKFKILLLSGFRYATYVMQYLIMLLIFGTQLGFEVLIGGIAALYAIQSGLPIPRILGVLVKVELAILIFSYEGESELIVLFSALSLWIVNRLAPAILGYFGLMTDEKRKRK